MAKGKYKRKRLAKERQEKIMLKDLPLSSDMIESLSELQITNAYELLRADKARVLEKGKIKEAELNEIIEIVKKQ